MIGKEILIKYCQERTAEEIYTFIRYLFDQSMYYTNSRLFFIDWLNEEQDMPQERSDKE